MNPPARAADLPEQPGLRATDGDAALCSNHAAVLARIAGAARAAGRDPQAVRLLAVSKTFDAARVRALAACGQRAFGESYLQEALHKIAACRDWRDAPAAGRSVPALEWHFIGPVQSNKTRPIAEHFDWVHSVEREKIAQRLSEQRPESMAPLQVCIQVNVSGEASKSGCAPAEAFALARAIAELPRLALRGLMTIPAPDPDPGRQQGQFARLRELFEALCARGSALDTLSMGMSDDLEAAIAEGSTMVRVGTALFGARPRQAAGG